LEVEWNVMALQIDSKEEERKEQRSAPTCDLQSCRVYKVIAAENPVLPELIKCWH
jgi:hypothetical protein